MYVLNIEFKDVSNELYGHFFYHTDTKLLIANFFNYK